MLDHQTDPTERALWHLELLGCYSPEDAVAPYVPEPAAPIDFDEDDWDDDEGCTHCGGEGFRQVDDIFWDDCDEFGWGPCTSCNGTGRRQDQRVF